MSLLGGLSLLCLFLVGREILGLFGFRKFGETEGRDTGFSLAYILLLLAVALATAWPTLERWKFERKLEEASRMLIDKPVRVHCNTIIDTFLDQNVMFAGHAHDGYYVLQHPYCDVLKKFLKQGGSLGKGHESGVFALAMLAHESMHLDGITNEAQTECAAIQRVASMARYLGLSAKAGREIAINYYYEYYPRRKNAAGYYWSAECGPGLGMDENLPSSPWNLIRKKADADS